MGERTSLANQYARGITLNLAFLTLAANPLAAADVDYLGQVKPVLAARCVSCHGRLAQKGKLRLDTAEFIRKGGRNGPAVVPGKSADSLLHQSLLGKDRPRMPPESDGHALSAEQITLIAAWIDQGAKGPTSEPIPEDPRRHWAFRPLVPPAVPTLPGTKSETRNAIDRIVLAKLAQHRGTPSPRADRRTLARRLHLDLIGLPPTPDELHQFLEDASPDAYDRLVDRLLASPHFGERWGRHWLDLARFAESDGYENDRLRPNAWRFRDWVVHAVNEDLPYDQFTIDQLAGDLLPRATIDQKVAAGFHRHTLWNSAASGDKEEFRTYAVKDRTDTTGMVWMGLTVGCAQCHSHKYDPVSHREYYQLYAFFDRTDNEDVKLPGKAMVPTLKAVARETRVHQRGNFLQPGPVVSPGTPAFLPPLQARKETADRLDLARWLVDPAHPLTARVAANHIWQHLFGVGLVSTPENFGSNGSPPRNPELLDWLATEFVRLRWSRKMLIRTIVLSATYQQSSHRGMDAREDPNNELLGRQNRFRVDAEIVRDASLAVSGLLVPKLGGPSIVPPFPEGLLDQKFTNEALKMPTAERHRRGIYIHVQRTLPHPILATFDAADGNSPCPRRDRSVTPIQALTLLNDPVFLECSRALGDRIRKSSREDDGRIRFAFEVCLARPPSDREQAILRGLLHRQRKLGAKEDAVWLGVARTLLNLEEFTTRE